jgi:hypothetical protein
VAWCGVPVSYRRAPRISPPTLTPDLQYFAYGILTLALELRDANRGRGENKRFNADEAFRVAAEAIESAVRPPKSRRASDTR